MIAISGRALRMAPNSMERRPEELEIRGRIDKNSLLYSYDVSEYRKRVLKVWGDLLLHRLHCKPSFFIGDKIRQVGK